MREEAPSESDRVHFVLETRGTLNKKLTSVDSHAYVVIDAKKASFLNTMRERLCSDIWSCNKRSNYKEAPHVRRETRENAVTALSSLVQLSLATRKLR